jgi:gliding motility-associated-like protein
VYRHYFLKYLIIVLLLFSHPAFSQYVLNGSARSVSCNCYTLTPATNFQSGSVWNGNKISLRNPFDFWFNVYLGCSDTGADGIVFMLQPLSTSIGSSGEGMGFGGVSPSIGIALDTYANSNLNDPSYDHISIQANGIINHNSDLAGPVPISTLSNNVEDCQWHKLRISWDPSTNWLRAYFDGVLRVEKQVDLIATIFNNDPMVYWGFSGATGGEVNLQQFCTALDPVFSNNNGCAGSTIQFISHSESFAPIASYTWDFGDGTSSAVQDPPPHIYNQPGNYPVKLKIKGLDGCENDTIVTVTIGSLPMAKFQVNDTCYPNTPTVLTQGNNFAVGWEWTLDGTRLPGQQPVLDNLPPGSHQLQLVLSSLYNCSAPDTANVSFRILPRPEVKMDFMQLCRAFTFSGIQEDSQTTIGQWNWRFGDGKNAAIQNPVYQYTASGQYPALLWAVAANGCSSDTVRQLIDVPSVRAFAGHDTTVISNLPFTLHAQGNGNFLWTPATGLSNPAIPDPVVTLTEKQTYVLTVTTREGCVARDTVNIRVMTGPMIYMPDAFTPNGDQLNDLLRPVYVGISKLERFAIYNRWGEMVFTTTDMAKGWDGKTGGQPAASGGFVWMIKGTNYLGQPVFLKGTVTLIK